MKLDNDLMRLYVITDRAWLKDNSLVDQVEDTINAGATFIQIREKELGYDEFVNLAKELKVVTDKYSIPFVINDNIDVALEVDADGVHIGQGDINASRARDLIGENKILGVSVQTVEQALEAVKNGADYLGVGAVFSTSTKKDADTVSHETLRQICNAVNVPVVAIGGIDENNVLELSKTTVDGIAVISAIFAKPDIKEATKKLRRLSDCMVNDIQK